MNLIIRADDVGYTDVCNIGAFETMENGVVTSADVMLDCPGTEDALRRLKELPWISVGWHTHFWGAPVLASEKVPSLYDPDRKGFRKDIRTAQDVVYEEILNECRAQLERCVRILGRAPDTGGPSDLDTPFGRALRQTEKEYGLKNNFMMRPALPGIPEEQWDGEKAIPAPFSVFRDLETDSLTEIEKYNPIRFYLEDQMGMLTMDVPDTATIIHAWHPGYLDYFVSCQGDYSPNAINFLRARVIDVHALCSPEIHNWVRDHKIRLINVRDFLYGTNEYQNHLRSIGSDLYLAEM